MKNVLALVAVVLALIAMALSWSHSPREVSGGAPVEAVDLGPVVARLTALEKETRELRHTLESQRLETPAREAVVSDVQLKEAADLSARFVQLEKALEELRAKQAATGPDGLGSRGPPPNARDGLTLDQATLRARDLAASEADRLKALGALRGQKLADGSDARLPVLDDMIRLAQSSNEGSTRADVWRQLSHVTDARLKGPLIDALALDKHDKAREEAAETLADFLPDAQVEAALRNASQNDSSKDVRKQAGSSLAGGH